MELAGLAAWKCSAIHLSFRIFLKWNRETVVVFNTEISITELSKLVNGNTSGKPQAFKLLKVQFPSES